jgi:hypothetical protein
MPTINRLVQQIARIRFGCVVRFAGTTVAALPMPTVGKDRFSVLGKMSPPIRDAVRAARMKKAPSCSLPF